MEDKIKLSYFYGREADQYSFYKIPKLLFTDSITSVCVSMMEATYSFRE